VHEQADSAPADRRALMTSLETEFPGWRVWCSPASWWATRRGPQWMREPRTVAADTADGLRRELLDARVAVGPGGPADHQ